jgi:hypothetical protein
MPFSQWASPPLSSCAAAPRTPQTADDPDTAAYSPPPCCVLPDRLGPGFKHSTVFPNRVRSIKRMILSLRALEKVDLVEMTVAREPDFSKSRVVLNRCSFRRWRSLKSLSVRL